MEKWPKTGDLGGIRLPLTSSFWKYDWIVQKFNLDFSDFGSHWIRENKAIEPPELVEKWPKTGDLGGIPLPLTSSFWKYDWIVQKFNLDFSDFGSHWIREIKAIEPPELVGKWPKTGDLGGIRLPLTSSFWKYDWIVQKFNLDFSDFGSHWIRENKAIEPPKLVEKWPKTGDLGGIRLPLTSSFWKYDWFVQKFNLDFSDFCSHW